MMLYLIFLFGCCSGICVVVLLIFIFLLLGGCVVGFNFEVKVVEIKEEKKVDVVLVEVVVVSYCVVVVSYIGIVVLELCVELQVVVKIFGVVLVVLVEEGQWVIVGQLLVWLDLDCVCLVVVQSEVQMCKLENNY